VTPARPPAIETSPEVEAALAAGRAVVALESTIIAHGFPRPDNIEVARAMEAAVREAGAVPATVAVLGGVVRVGLAAAELERLAFGADVAKCSTRDLAFVRATGGDGATTVAATARLAAAAGIAVFATGGIGGVHRGAGTSFDVSADLVELGRTRVAVVCSGAKSILDLAATCEALETHGVAVIGFRCDEFPAFYSRESGLGLTRTVADVTALAAVVRSHRDLDLPGGLVVCNPPPADVALARDELDALVERALSLAAAEGVGGGALTPFLLAALDRLSKGRTRAVNRALAVGNAALAGRLASALAAG